MKELIFLCLGSSFLMYLSQAYYPLEYKINKNSSLTFGRPKLDTFMALAIFWMTCFSFLRTSYNDTGAYIDAFMKQESLSELFPDGFVAELGNNPLYQIYTVILRSLTDNYHIFFLFPALLCAVAVIRLLKKYSINPAISLIVFFSVGTYVFYIAALKQSIALFFVLSALPYAIDKKYLRFFALVIIAALFHSRAVIFAVVPLLMFKPWGKITYILLGFVLYLMLTYDQTMKVVIDLADTVGMAARPDEIFDGHKINAVRVIVYWIPAVLMLFFRERLFHDSTKTENLFANMSILSAFILMIGLVQGANLYGRMAGYFEVATAVVLPWIIHKLFVPQSASMISVIASVLYFGYFMFEFGISKNFGDEYTAISLWQFVKELLH